MTELRIFQEYISSNLNNLNIDLLNQYIEQACTNLSINQAANQILINSLPELKKPVIRILEISATSGSYTQKAIRKYQNSCQRIEATVLFINKTAHELSQIIFQKYFPCSERLKLTLSTDDFLISKLGDFDVIVGLPLISKVQGQTKKDLCAEYEDNLACNTAAFITQKALRHGDNIALFLPKYFLNNLDFIETRKAISKFQITHIYDYSEIAFKESHQEIISITINKKSPPNNVFVSSLANKQSFSQQQTHITDNMLNIWTIYTNPEFREWIGKMEFGLFDVYRDRQLKKSDLKSTGEIKVLKAINLPRDGRHVIHTDKDKYIDVVDLEGLSSAKFLHRTDVYLCPNLTTKPRLIAKPENCIASGSLAILIPKKDTTFTTEDIAYFASTEFEYFYNICRNLSTRSLNIDKPAAYLFGKRCNKSKTFFLSITPPHEC